MWDGFDRYLKTQEVSGKLAFDLREFQFLNERQMRTVWEEIEKRVTEDNFQEAQRKQQENFSSDLQMQVDTLNQKCKQMEEDY